MIEEDICRNRERTEEEQQKENKEKEILIKPRSFYRGGTISEKEVEMLEMNIGGFVEMEGFTSTTAKKDMEMLHMFSSNVVFEIIVPDLTQQPRDDETDFGFISVQEFSQFPQEEEYLFNVLNVFKILSISDYEFESKDKTVKWVKLEYGSLAEAMQKKKELAKLSIEEERLVFNYQYYSTIRQKIQNLGDCLLEQNYFKKAREFYKKRVDNTTNF